MVDVSCKQSTTKLTVVLYNDLNTEQCNISVIAAVPLISFPLQESDDHTPQQIRGMVLDLYIAARLNF